MEVAPMRCTVKLEKISGSGGGGGGAIISSNKSIKDSELSLARNEFKEIILVVQDRDRKLRIPIKHDELVVHRKFAGEGKATLTVKDQRVTVFVSNAPPHHLCQFLKALAAKLAGGRGAPALTARKKLLSGLPQSLDGISPVTQKDVKNLKSAEAGGKGLLRINLASPATPSSGRHSDSKKRRRLIGGGDKENGPESTPTRKRRTLSARRPLTSRHELTAEQRYVLEAVKGGRNVFFTGGAGTGKSFLVRKCIGALPPDATFVTASTGVAAYQIGGVTLHSFAGVGGGDAPLQQCVEMVRRRRAVLEAWKKCRHLVIDEISMVDGRFFEKLEAVARAVRGNDRPFGGIQLVLAGDFLQLPPVTRKKEERTFCFETAAWKKSVHVNLELTNVKRQSDSRFVDILKSLRNGRCSDEDAAVLKATALNDNIDHGGEIVASKLCTHSEDVDHINRTELAKLPGECKGFAAIDSDPGLSKFMDSHTPVEARIGLKVGAQVMLLKNQNVAQGLVNGARGRVVGFDRKSGCPVVKFACGVKEEVRPEKWMVKSAGGALLSRKQLPLRLAWAFSIHKSQGMTLDSVEISLARVFECGQAYVALSRAKSLDCVRIVDFRASCIRADPKVLRFYRDLRITKPTIQTVLVA